MQSAPAWRVAIDAPTSYDGIADMRSGVLPSIASWSAAAVSGAARYAARARRASASSVANPRFSRRSQETSASSEPGPAEREGAADVDERERATAPSESFGVPGGLGVDGGCWSRTLVGVALPETGFESAAR